MSCRALLFFSLAILLVLPACSGSKTADDVIAVQLNWKAESEHGGLYQAEADGLYSESNQNVKIVPGGPGAKIGAELALERCQFAMANADDVVLLRADGIDIVAVMAAMQDHPRCVMVRADSGIKSLKDLAGKTFQHGPRPFAEFMRSEGLLKDVKEVPYQGSIAGMVADPNVIIQAYSSSEPLLARQEGLEVDVLMVSELGFNPYSSVLVTSGKLIRENPDRVQKFVTATRQGWRNYLTDPAKGNAGILEANPQMTAEALDLGMDELRRLAQPNELPLESVGEMSVDRWEQLVDQLTKLDLLDTPVAASDCFTLEFLK